MSKSRVPTKDSATGSRPTLGKPDLASGDLEAFDEGLGDQEFEGNAEVQERVAGAQAPGPPPPEDPMDAATGGPPEDLPYLRLLEERFGQDLSGVEAHTGQGGPMAAMGADAAARGEEVAFSEDRPAVETVAHEATHYLQFRQTGRAATQASGAISDPSSSAETEAEQIGARVAAGGAAGPVEAAPADAVHRKQRKTVPEGSREEKLDGKTWYVFPDTVFLEPMAATKESDFLSETEFAAKKKESELLKKVAVARTALIGAARGQNGFEVATRVQDLVDGLDAEVHHRLFGDRTLWNESHFADIQRLRLVVNAADPLTRLVRGMQRAAFDPAGGTPGKAFDALKQWSKAYPDQCQRALESSDTMAAISRYAVGHMVEATQYLLGKGVLPDTPLAKVTLAIEQKQKDAFVEAWFALEKADAEAFKGKLSDPLFYQMVDDRLGGAGSLVILQSMRRYGLEDAPKEGELGDAEKATVQAFLKKAIPEMARAVASKDVDGMIRAVRWYRDEVKDKLGNFDAGSAQSKHLAITSVSQAMKKWDEAVAESIGRLEVLSALRASGDSAGWRKASTYFKLAEHESFEVAKGFVDPRFRTELSKEERAKLEPVVQGHVRALVALFDGWTVDGLKVWQELSGFQRWTLQNIRPLEPDNHESVWATHERRRHAYRLLADGFRTASGGRDLEKTIEKETGGYMGASALAVTGAMSASVDLEDDPDLYTDHLTDLDHKKLKPIFEEYGGQIAKEMRSLLWVSDDYIHKKARQIREKVRVALEPKKQGAKTLNAWHRKTEKAMVAFRTWYDGEHGGLVKAVHDHVQDESQRREVLMHFEDRRDENDETTAATIGALHKDDASAAASAGFLAGFHKKINGMAEDFYSVLANATPRRQRSWHEKQLRKWSDDLSVSDRLLQSKASRFAPLAKEYVDNVPGGTLDDAGRYLDRAYTALGGDLKGAISAAMGDDALPVLRMLRLSWTRTVEEINADERYDQAQARTVKEAGLSDKDAARKEIEFDQRIREHVVGASRMLALFTADTGTLLRTRQWEIVRPQLYLVAAEILTEPGGFEMAVRSWLKHNGIPMLLDLGLHLWGKERAWAAKAFRVDESRLPAPEGSWDFWSEQSDAESAVKKGDAKALGKDFVIDEGKVRDGFTLQTALERAQDLHKRAQKLPSGLRSFREALHGGRGGGRAEESRVIRAVFRKVYGYDLAYLIRQAFPEGSTVTDDLLHHEETTGKLDLGHEIRGLVYNGDIEKIKKRTLEASPDEKKTLAADRTTLFMIRRAFGDEAYDRIFRTVTGQLTTYDMMRDRDEDPWFGMGLGLGTDEAGMRRDMKAWFVGFKAKLRSEIAKVKAGLPKTLTEEQVRVEVAKHMDAAMQKEAYRIFTDPSTKAIVESELGGEELFEMRAIILGKGEAKATDKAMVETVATFGSVETLLAQLKAMTPAERAAKRKDPLFLAQLARLAGTAPMTGNKLAGGQLYEVLYADVGHQFKVDFQDATHRNSYDSVDENKVFDTLYGMSEADIERFMADQPALVDLRAKLGKKDRAKLDAFLDAASKSVAGNGGAATTDPEKKKAMRRDLLVLSHSGRLLRAISQGTLRLMDAAQKTYTEKGTVQLDPQDPTKTEDVFGKPEREKVWAAVSSPLAKIRDEKGFTARYHDGEKVYQVVRSSLLDHEKPENDPAVFRIEEGFRGFDNKDMITGALDNASPRLLAFQWSNMRQPGPGSADQSLKDRYEAMVASRTARDAEKKADEGKSEPGTAHLAAQKTFERDQRRFHDHRLNVSHTLLEYLRQRDASTFRTTTDKERFDYQQKLQQRILLIPPEVAAQAVGVKSGPYADADKAAMMSGSRRVRSEYESRRDKVDHHAGSGDGAWAPMRSERDVVDMYSAIYTAELGQAISTEGGQQGQLSEDEIARIDAAGARTDEAVADYQAAKMGLVKALKFLAMLIIAAVATVLTGPGGPTLLMAMMTTAASSAAGAIIEEAVMGDEYSFTQDGLKGILVDTLVTGATLGMGKAVTAAGAKWGSIAKISDGYKKFAAWEKGLAEGASKSFPGFAKHGMYSAGKVALDQHLDAAKAALVGSLDPSVWKMGTAAGGYHTHEQFAKAFSGMDDRYLRGLFMTLVNNTTGALKHRLWPQKFGGTPLEGVDLPEPMDMTRQDAALSAAMAVLGEFSVEKLGPKIVDAGAAVLAKKILDGDLLRGTAWSVDDLAAFLESLGKKQATAVVTGAAGAIQRARTHNKKVERLEEAKAAFAAQEVGDGVQLEALMTHYKHYLDSDAKFEGHRQALGMSPADWKKKEFDPLQKKVLTFLQAEKAKVADGVDSKATEYYRWVMATPGQVETRLRSVSLEKFRVQYVHADKAKRDIVASDAYKALPAWKRGFYDQFLADPTRLRDMEKGADKEGLDVRTEAGRKALDGKILGTQRAILRGLARPLLEEARWAPGKQAAYFAFINAADSRSLPYFEVGNDTVNGALAKRSLEGWGGKFDSDPLATKPEIAKSTRPTQQIPVQNPDGETKAEDRPRRRTVQMWAPAPFDDRGAETRRTEQMGAVGLPRPTETEPRPTKQMWAVRPDGA
jgi:hypothetical protein